MEETLREAEGFTAMPEWTDSSPAARFTPPRMINRG